MTEKENIETKFAGTAQTNIGTINVDRFQNFADEENYFAIAKEIRFTKNKYGSYDLCLIYNKNEAKAELADRIVTPKMQPQ